MKLGKIVATIFILSILLSACGSNSAKLDSNSAISSDMVVDDEIAEKERCYYSLVEYTIDALKEQCVLLASLEINNVIVASKRDFDSADEANSAGLNEINIYVDYSAKNEIGNYKDGYTRFMMGMGAFLDFTVDDAYNSYYKIAMGRSEQYQEIATGFYQAIDTSLDFKIVFLVDLTDYDNQGYIR